MAATCRPSGIACCTKIITSATAPNSQTEKGIPNRLPVPMKLKASCPRTPCRSAPPRINAVPRTTLSIASVTMIGGSSRQATSAPLTRPTSSPAPSAVASEAGKGQPASSEKTATSPASASTGPTDRSMPPVMITKVMPTAMMPTSAV